MLSSWWWAEKLPETCRAVVATNKQLEDYSASVGFIHTSSATEAGFFTTSESKSDDDDVLAAEGVFAFHTVQHHSIYKTIDCTSVLFKTIFWNNLKIFSTQ